MKKLLTMILSVTLACAAPVALTACGQKSGTDEGTAAEATDTETTETEATETEATDTEATEQGETASFATLGDVFKEETDSMTSTFDEQRYVCTFNLGGTWWRVEAALEDGMYDQLNEAWTEDQTKVEELLTPLAVTKAEIKEPLDAEAIEAYIGKTGADLTADGFVFPFGTLVVNGNETDCSATMGDFDYLVTFDGAVEDENTEDPAGAVADLTVSAINVQSISWTALEG